MPARDLGRRERGCETRRAVANNREPMRGFAHVISTLMSCPAKAGHPVTPRLAFLPRYCGLLDRPLSRAMTPSRENEPLFQRRQVGEIFRMGVLDLSHERGAELI